MKLKIYIPPNKNLPFDSIRMGYSSSSEQKIIRTPPFGKPAVILFLNPNSVNNYSTESQGILLGQHTQPLMLDLNENYKVMAFHLKPFALKQLLNIDASQLTNKYISIQGIEVFERLYELVLQKIDVEKQLIPEIHDFFSTVRFYEVSYEVSAFFNFLQVNKFSTISKVAQEIGCTERNLERKFKAEVGLSPKKYVQIKRVFEVFEHLKEDVDWQQIVVDYNYTDQAHLITEFKKYASIAPGLYVRKGLTIAKQLPPSSTFEV